MNLLNDVITYVRRIIKSPSNTVITDSLIIDYINRFWIMDVDARIQLFDLKTKYQFQTQPGVDQYNMPLYSLQPASVTTPSQSYTGPVAMYPVYQGFVTPAFINGIEVPLQTQKSSFFNGWPNVVQNMTVVCIGNGTAGPYTLKFPILPDCFPNPPNPPNFPDHLNPPLNAILRGHIDIQGIISTNNNVDPPIIAPQNVSALIPQILTTSVESRVFITSQDATGANVEVWDTGIFDNTNVNLGYLMNPGKAPYGNTGLPNGYGASFPITGITLGNPTIITATTNFLPGQVISISGVAGTTQLNNNSYTIISVTPTTVTINVDSTAFSPYISSGLIFSELQNVINYFTGVVTNLYFPVPIPQGRHINAQCFFFQSGLPRGILFYNNTLTLRAPPSQQYLVELDAYLSPAAFLNTSQALPFAYMAEYIARGAARKILTDTGDVEQFQFYEPLFKEQETLVHIRAQRQWTNNRTETLYSRGMNYGNSGLNNNGGSTL